MSNFSKLGIPSYLVEHLATLGFVTPTGVQEQVIPEALEGKDILASAQTGSGKTMAFAIPIICKLMENPHSIALVLTPTRELAAQIVDVVHKLLGTNKSIRTALLIGGDSMMFQLKQLKNKPRILIGTPGRVNDHIDRGSLPTRSIDMLVLDETDRMLSMGFDEQIEKTIQSIAKKRQTLMFSATMPKSIVTLTEQYLTNPSRIAVGSTTDTAPNIKQEVLFVDQHQKYDNLLTQLNNRDGSIIVFVKTKVSADQLAQNLSDLDYQARALHGDLMQSKRTRIISAFRKKSYRILVATDVAARGLDIDHIKHVINYDMPHCPEDYIHRVGRTARGEDSTGEAICFVSLQDYARWNDIAKMMKLPANQFAPSVPRGKKSSAPRRNRFSQGSAAGSGAGYRDRPERNSEGGGYGAARPARRPEGGGYGAPRSDRRPEGHYGSARPARRPEGGYAPRPPRDYGDNAFRGNAERRPESGYPRPRRPQEGGQLASRPSYKPTHDRPAAAPTEGRRKPFGGDAKFKTEYAPKSYSKPSSFNARKGPSKFAGNHRSKG